MGQKIIEEIEDRSERNFWKIVNENRNEKKSKTIKEEDWIRHFKEQFRGVERDEEESEIDRKSNKL